VFVTHLPCAMCAKRLINLGNVKNVVYANDYRKRDSVELFAQVGVSVHQLSVPSLPGGS
jgi:deoxycytidylate deaminase